MQSYRDKEDYISLVNLPQAIYGLSYIMNTPWSFFQLKEKNITGRVCDKYLFIPNWMVREK